MMSMDSHAEATVELNTISRNVEALCGHVAPATVMAVVKANGYGHGAVPAARAAVRGGAGWLGVVHVAEALELRRAGIDTPLLCLMAIGSDQHADAIAASVDLAAALPGMVRRLAAAAVAAGRPARVHLKADTGLSRGGATAADWPSVLETARQAEAEAASPPTPGSTSPRRRSRQPFIEAQLLQAWRGPGCSPRWPGIDAVRAHDRRRQGRADARIPATTQCGSAAARTASPRFPARTPGLAAPGDDAPGQAGACEAGSRRDGGVLRAPLHHDLARTTSLAVLVGHADGILRAATGLLLVARGRRWPIAGTVCMDQLMIDFGDEPVAEGDEVVIFGPGEDGEPTAQEWGDTLRTISYEIVTGIGARVPRVHRA